MRIEKQHHTYCMSYSETSSTLGQGYWSVSRDNEIVASRIESHNEAMEVFQWLQQADRQLNALGDNS